ncbi:MFS transporter [Lactobacillus ultunensis]|uniref:Putative ATP synthase F0, A subunit n=1 Tax=Lactobacillus ultunensis DSM 16047 TaxID=525365 RepID=C2ELQ8_9LACO|nr:MFS transporter [Lactobacillus ultunensis]EEJ72480.1 putative ATP synthase F0, A subunit [Lactobacillus ultunensis DSM 16047]KRL81899.1 major facilitator family transporter [Lactobacillus ultunensis DSM 16047]
MRKAKNKRDKIEEEEAIKNWDPRYKRNVILYLCIYGVMGAVTGITNDASLSYYSLVAPHLISALNLFEAMVSILISILILSVHNMGYRKVLLALPPLTAVFMILTTLTTNQPIIIISYILSSSAIGVYDLMYPLMWTSYVPSKIRTKMFTVVMVINLVTESIMMFIGGKAVVYIFSKLQGISYRAASNLSAQPDAMKGVMLANYTNAYKWVIIITALITFIAFALALFIKDKPVDYRSTEDKSAKPSMQEKMATYKKLVNYKTVVWVLYICAVQLGAGLFIQYVPIYLNNILHIPRGITSTINTLQTVAIFVGYFFAPYLAKKLGSIMTIAISTIICAPLMLVMANAKMLGTGAVLFGVVGTILFFHSGLANASMPVQQEVQMILVDKDLRPAFSAVIEVALSVVGVIDGLFTEFYLLKTQQGYANAYIIAAALYIVSGIVLIIVFAKKYNRILRDSHASEEAK